MTRTEIENMLEETKYAEYGKHHLLVNLTCAYGQILERAVRENKVIF